MLFSNRTVGSVRLSKTTKTNCLYRTLSASAAKLRFLGAVAQSVEHLLCKQEVVGSIPIRSTTLHEDRWVSAIFFRANPVINAQTDEPSLF